MNLGHVGGKRVLAPRVTGNGVTSKQPARLPPRAAVVSLDDVDVTAHRDVSEHPIRSPPERYVIDRMHKFMPNISSPFPKHVLSFPKHVLSFPSLTVKVNPL